MADDLTPDDDESPEPAHTDTGDELSDVVARIVARRDAKGDEFDADEILAEIERDHRDAILRKGTQLARRACRRLIALHLRRITDDHDGPQISLPGLERVPTHINFYAEVNRNGKKTLRIRTRSTLVATLAQHRSSLAIKQRNKLHCIESEARQQRIVDLLESAQCDSLAQWHERFGEASA